MWHQRPRAPADPEAADRTAAYPDPPTLVPLRSAAADLAGHIEHQTGVRLPFVERLADRTVRPIGQRSSAVRNRTALLLPAPARLTDHIAPPTALLAYLVAHRTDVLLPSAAALGAQAANPFVRSAVLAVEQTDATSRRPSGRPDRTALATAQSSSADLH